jgi:uncharacterized protein (TIGR02452 family)
MAKEEYVKMFNDTLRECQEEKYKNDLIISLNGSKLYKRAPEIRSYKEHETTIILNRKSTLECAKAIENVCVLNFASAISVGGGVKSGANAQEESICRASSLYYALMLHPEYYEKNIENQPLYTDWTIYTPNVLVIKDEFTGKHIDPFKISVVTCPAPYYHSVKDPSEIERIYNSRINVILSVMQENGHKDIVLGAWGCGAFGNDPILIAKAFRKALRLKKYTFENVYFPIYGRESNFDAFVNEFNGYKQ